MAIFFFNDCVFVPYFYAILWNNVHYWFLSFFTFGTYGLFFIVESLAVRPLPLQTYAILEVMSLNVQWIALFCWMRFGLKRKFACWTLLSLFFLVTASLLESTASCR